MVLYNNVLRLLVWYVVDILLILCYVPALIRISLEISHPPRLRTYASVAQYSTVSQNCIFNTAEEKAAHLIRRRLGKVREGQQEGEGE